MPELPEITSENFNESMATQEELDNTQASIDAHTDNVSNPHEVSLSDLEKPTNHITVALDNGEFSSIKEAMDSITDNSIMKPYTITVQAGVYTEDNPILCKSFVTVIGNGSVIINAQNNTEDVLQLEANSFIYGISIQNATSSNAISKTSASNSTLKDITFIDCDCGLYMNSTGSIFAYNITILSIFETPTNGINVESGNVTIQNIVVGTDTTLTNIITISGSNSIATIDNVTSFSPNVVDGVHLEHGCNCVIRNVSIVGASKGINTYGALSIRLMNTVIFNCVTGIYIDWDESATESQVASIGLTGCEIRECTNNIIVINDETTMFGSGNISDSSSFIVNPNATPNISFIDTFGGDEGLTILGELHVGSPTFPKESVFGEGDSYTIGMLVYTYDGSSYVDVSAEAASSEGSVFTFPNGTINSAIYMSSLQRNAGDFVKHYGIKLNITDFTAPEIHDITVTVSGAADAVDVTGDYDYEGSDFSNHPVYEITGGGIYLFNVDGYWCFDIVYPDNKTRWNKTLYYSVALENAYIPIAPNVDIPTLVYNPNISASNIVTEYYDGETSSWVEVNTMITQSNPPYMPYSKHVEQARGNYQIRYDSKLYETPWEVNDDVGLGTELYWIRFRIINTMTSLPEIQQIKLHSSRCEINGNGWLEYFGSARPIRTLPWDGGLLQAAASSPANQDLFISDVLDVGRIENEFVNGATDRIGLNAYLPYDVDTSSGIRLKWTVTTDDNTLGNIEWNVRWGYSADGYNVFGTTGDAPATGPNEQSINLVALAPALNTQKTYEVFLNIEDTVSRRDGGYGDILWVSIERDGGDAHGGDVAMINLRANYYAWCDGGHI